MQSQLLIAHPLFNGGFFSRSVIYLTNHSDDGTVGFSLNFKTQFMLRDIRPQVKNGNFPIYEGGPVAKDQLFFLHMLGHDISDSVHIGDNIFIGGNFDELLHKIEHGKVKSHQVKFFSGYSGWKAYQLDGEIGRRHWLVNQPANTNFFREEPDCLWGQQLGEIKSSYAIFSDFNFDPSRN